jgi:hypothetical protein
VSCRALSIGMGLLAAGCLACAPARQGGPATTTFTDPERGLQVDVPAGWHAVSAEYTPSHPLSVFLTINNRVPGFRLAGWTEPRRELQPGMICILLGEGTGGPPGVPVYDHERTFDDALAQWLQRSKSTASTSGTLLYPEIVDASRTRKAR